MCNSYKLCLRPTYSMLVVVSLEFIIYCYLFVFITEHKEKTKAKKVVCSLF